MTDIAHHEYTPLASATEIGIGMRVSIHPHTNDFVAVILGALEDVAAAGLTRDVEVTTDEVSTYIGPRGEHPEQQLADYLSTLLAAAHRRSGGGHVVAHVLLSRGCPGEATCDLTERRLPSARAVSIAATGIAAAAQWSLYPLLDGGGEPQKHLPIIEAEIARAQARGLASHPAHYATMLRGDVADVVATGVDTWARVGSHVPHVVTHLTISTGSPTALGA